MIVKRLFEPLLAQNSYLIGCAHSGEAIVIDPHRDLELYLETASASHLSITQVTETHIHADFLSGSRELARRTGATLWLSDAGDDRWKYGFAAEGRALRDGDRLDVGRVRIEVVHTPGHTPEHLTFLVTDRAVADAAIAAVTGDFLFVGDVGRPDLLERAAQQRGTMQGSARSLYQSLQSFSRHHDWLQLWPGHGAGSSCGKGISAVPHSTLGYERRFSWAFQTTSEDEFVLRVLAGQPDPPPYFRVMKQWNQQGPAPRPPARPLERISDDQLDAIQSSGAVVIDARSAETFAANFSRGALNLPLNNSFISWAGWFVPYDRDLYLLVANDAESELPALRRALSLIGLDRVKGYFSPTAIDRVCGDHRGRIDQLTPGEVADDDERPLIVDVRHAHEWAEGHLPGAIHLPLGRLRDRLSELPAGRPLVVHCAAGARSAIAGSILAGAGFDRVSNLIGGYQAWRDAGLPTSSS